MQVRIAVLVAATAGAMAVSPGLTRAEPAVLPMNGPTSVPAIISTLQAPPLASAMAVTPDDSIYVTGFSDDDSAATLTQIPPGTLSGAFTGQAIWPGNSRYLPINLDFRDDTLLITGWQVGGAQFISSQRSLQFSVRDDTVAAWSQFDLTGFAGISPALASDGCSAIYPNTFDDTVLYEQCGGPGGFPDVNTLTSSASITADDTVFLVGDDSVMTFTLDDTQTATSLAAITSCTPADISLLSFYLDSLLVDDSLYYVSDCSGLFSGTSTLGVIDSVSGAVTGTIPLGSWLPVRIRAGNGRLLIPGVALGSRPTLHLVDPSGQEEQVKGPDGWEVGDAVEISTGLVYASFYRSAEFSDSSQITVIDDVSSSSVSMTGVPGDEFSVTLTTATANPWFDDMVESISVGGRAASYIRTGNSLKATVPSIGSCTIVAPLRCQASVVVNLLGGNSLTVGTFTYALPPIPPGMPGAVTGVAGDSSATITWSPPASSGSFPVSTYQAVVSPGGQSCLSVSSPCVISGLSNGTEYTVAVRALSGAGWGAFSNPSAPFTPQAPVEKSILITGTRGEVRGRPGVIVSGSSTGMAGEQVAPWVKLPGQTSYTEGVSRVTVNAEGDFTWQRRTGKKVYVYFRGIDSDVKSNRVIIRPR